MCSFMCTFKVHIKSARAHVHIYVHFKGAHVHFQSAHVHFLCSKSNSTSTPIEDEIAKQVFMMMEEKKL